MPGGIRKTVTRIVALVVALALSILFGVRAALPPAPLAATVPAAAFSAMRALPDVRTIATRPHPTGSPGNIAVRDYLRGRLAALGLSPDTRRYLIEDAGLKRLRQWSAGASTTSELVDLVGILPGRDRTLPAVLLMAHYDTVWGSPGGGDDSAGVAATLEIVRAIRARGTPRRDVIVLFTDGEEIGLSGARAFFGGDPLVRHVGAVVNLEARGAGGRATMFETGEGNAGLIALFARGVAHPVANSLTVLAYRHMPNDTDFTPVRERGVPGFNFAILGRARYYHSPLATADRLDPASLQDLGGQALDIVAALADARTLPRADGDATFFDPGGRRLIAYRAAQGWLVVLGVLVALGAAVAGARRAGLLRGAEVGQGAIALGWLLIHAALALTAFNRLSGSAAHADYYDRLAALPRLEAQAALLCLAALAGFLILRRPTPRWWGAVPAVALALLGIVVRAPVIDTLALAAAGAVAGMAMPPRGVSLWGGWLAALGLLALLAIVAQIEAPAAAWLFAWPGLVLGLAAAFVAWTDPAWDRPWTPIPPAVAAILVTAPLLALAHMAFLAIGASMPEALLALLPILAAAFWPLARAPRGVRPVLLLALAALVAAATLAVQVRIDPIADSIPAYALDK